MEKKIKVINLNQHITCNICKGYLIDATAITECLHTFCKSCIIKHLEANTNCPTCDIVIHHSYPRQYINFDRTMQDVVYKLVPGLLEREIEREKEFYSQRGLPYPKEVLLTDDIKDGTVTEPPAISPNSELPKEELISVCLDCNLVDLIKKVFVRVPTKTTVQHLAKFVASKICNNTILTRDVQIYDSCDLLNGCDNLKFINVKRIKNEDVPYLHLYCKIKTSTS